MKFRASVIVAMAMVNVCSATTGQAESNDDESRLTPAWFDGRWIDLAHDWGDAQACTVGTDRTTCFRTESEMDEALNSSTFRPNLSIAPLAACSTSLRLHDGTSYTGSLLSLSTRSVVLNLASYSFDNITSSYKVGACAADFYSNPSAGGSLYPGNTSANAQTASMSTGWNNLVSSVYIS